MNIVADATAVAPALGLGLDIELPDPDNEDPAYWEQVHADGGYKRRIEGRIADPWWDGDPDWALLLRLPWGEVWFDIEEGVKISSSPPPRSPPRPSCSTACAKGIGLSGEDGRSLVWVSPTRFDDGVLEWVRERLEAAGLVQGRNEIVWELPPERR